MSDGNREDACKASEWRELSGGGFHVFLAAIREWIRAAAAKQQNINLTLSLNSDSAPSPSPSPCHPDARSQANRSAGHCAKISCLSSSWSSSTRLARKDMWVVFFFFLFLAGKRLSRIPYAGRRFDAFDQAKIKYLQRLRPGRETATELTIKRSFSSHSEFAIKPTLHSIPVYCLAPPLSIPFLLPRLWIGVYSFYGAHQATVSNQSHFKEAWAWVSFIVPGPRFECLLRPAPVPITFNPGVLARVVKRRERKGRSGNTPAHGVHHLPAPLKRTHPPPCARKTAWAKKTFGYTPGSSVRPSNTNLEFVKSQEQPPTLSLTETHLSCRNVTKWDDKHTYITSRQSHATFGHVE